jgi:hypothetical protein
MQTKNFYLRNARLSKSAVEPDRGEVIGLAAELTGIRFRSAQTSIILAEAVRRNRESRRPKEVVGVVGRFLEGLFDHDIGKHTPESLSVAFTSEWPARIPMVRRILNRSPRAR